MCGDASQASTLHDNARATSTLDVDHVGVGGEAVRLGICLPGFWVCDPGRSEEHKEAVSRNVGELTHLGRAFGRRTCVHQRGLEGVEMGHRHHM